MDNLPEYPDETEGSRMARMTREQCNSLTREERDALFKRAMELIRAASEPPPGPSRS
jgi:hypothetical protein